MQLKNPHAAQLPRAEILTSKPPTQTAPHVIPQCDDLIDVTQAPRVENIPERKLLQLNL